MSGQEGVRDVTAGSVEPDGSRDKHVVGDRTQLPAAAYELLLVTRHQVVNQPADCADPGAFLPPAIAPIPVRTGSPADDEHFLLPRSACSYVSACRGRDGFRRVVYHRAHRAVGPDAAHADGQSRADIDHDGWADLPTYARAVVRPRLFLGPPCGAHDLRDGWGAWEVRTGGTMPRHRLGLHWCHRRGRAADATGRCQRGVPGAHRVRLRMECSRVEGGTATASSLRARSVTGTITPRASPN